MQRFLGARTNASPVRVGRVQVSKHKILSLKCGKLIAVIMVFALGWALISSHYQLRVTPLLVETDYNVSRQSSEMLGFGTLESNTAQAPAALSSTRPADPSKVFLFTHHKTGTMLSTKLAVYFGQALRVKVRKLWIFPHEQIDKYVCPSEEVVLYGSMEGRFLEAIQRVCPPNWRAIHFIRDPIEIVLSAYLYHLRRADDAIPGSNQTMLVGKPISEGLMIEAKADLHVIFPGMLSVHEIAKNDSRIVQVSLEDISTNYNQTFSKIFGMLLGRTHAKINELIGLAAQSDVSRWSAQQRSWGHLANATLKQEARNAMWHLMQNRSHPIIADLQSVRRKLGYSLSSLS